jgi:hypothetical protein
MSVLTYYRVGSFITPDLEIGTALQLKLISTQRYPLQILSASNYILLRTYIVGRQSKVV